MFPTTVLWFLVAMLSGMVPEKTADEVARDAGVVCDRGCIVAPGIVYRITRDDLVIMARAANCEVRDAIGTDDAAAAMWALVSNFVRRKMVGRNETLAAFVSAYSACTGVKWSSAGWARNSRITPRADANRQLRWRDIPQRTRDYVLSFFRNEHANPMPGVVYVLTSGFEFHASNAWYGPYYANTRGPGSFNAYWRDPKTIGWTASTVRLVAPTVEPEEAQQQP